MRSVIGLERSPFYEDIVLTLHDYYFVGKLMINIIIII
jgi:hypothetical protein